MPAAVIREVSFNYPRQRRALSPTNPRIKVYALLEQEICHDYRHQPSYRALYDGAENGFQKVTAQKLKRGLELKLGPLMFDLCLRYATIRVIFSHGTSSVLTTSGTCARSLAGALPDGIDCPVDPLDIIRYLQALARIPGPNGEITYVYGNSRLLRLHAIAALAWISFRQYLWSPHPQSFELLSSCIIIEQCLSYVELLARSDFLPPILLRIAGWLSAACTQYGKLDARHMNEASRNAEDFWKAYDRYLQDQQAQEQKRLAKVAKTPNQYRCAADGCSIQAMNKGALRKCGGPCLPEQKPHYCSAECQEKVSVAKTLLFVINDVRKLSSTGSFIVTCVHEMKTYCLTTEIRHGKMLIRISPNNSTGHSARAPCGLHGRDRRYSSTFPTLAGIVKRLSVSGPRP